MTIGRRTALNIGGGALATLVFGTPTFALSVVTIEMKGTTRGEHAWFEPNGLAVAPGTRIVFVNRDAANSHTATAYHPDAFGRQRRIPSAAAPWESDFLLPGEGFEVTLAVLGVYDYYCVPHELHGMVGRIVVGKPDDVDWEAPTSNGEDLPEAAKANLIPVSRILSEGRITER